MKHLRSGMIGVVAAAAAACAPVDRIPEEIARHPALSQLYAGKFPIGAAVEPAQLDSREGALLAWQFNGIVAENAMKAANVQPAEGRFDFAGADRIVEFGERRSMRIRGHTLLWHEETPEWFWREADGTPASRALVLERLRLHIEALVGRYRGRVRSWDVVNEVVDATSPDCLRNSRWKQVVGPGYIEWAFRQAHAADPAARLLINDFETTDPAKRACLLRVVGDLLRRGVPVHGVGHQLHASLERPTAREVEETLDAFAALGLDNEVTELDITLGPAPLPLDASALVELQATRYGELFRLFARRPDVKAVTFWGISDAHTWLNMARASGGADAPLLFDANQQPKPAYAAVASAAR